MSTLEDRVYEDLRHAILDHDDAAIRRVAKDVVDLGNSTERNSKNLRGVRGEIRLLIQEMRTGFAMMEKRFEAVDQRFEAVERRFEAVDKRFDDLIHTMDKRFEAVDRRFNDLIHMLDKRFEDVRHSISRSNRLMIWIFSIAATMNAATIGILFAVLRTLN